MIKWTLIFGAVVCVIALALSGHVNTNASSPAPTQAEQQEHAQDLANRLRVVDGAATLRKAMRNPGSFNLSSAILLKTGTVCYTYGAQNGFGGMNIETAVMTPKGRILTSEADVNRMCAGRSGQEMVTASN